ncbi:RNA polymerase sigma factor [Kutzneria albida]|uniref:ECF subfamily RNA polymerase sigma-24 factor n=1 Tax=Kutzneria albida DSM 43870 TaxID=1449976 RepID=W5W5C8_9PSEU|nr:RNA polymerase sigma factor [Kutzneria albida]AHH96102.1 ECF subfamily RNA polymerase sigma-24 factor [Kutzneria albida DSM 43870]
MEEETDEALLAGLAEDLDAGFHRLVRDHEPLVHSVVLRASGRPEEAEDLAAETFLRAYRALRGYDRARILALRLKPWLLTIALNTWRNAARDASRRPHHVPVATLPERLHEGPGVEELVESGESQRELGALLADLPQAQRTAVVLRHVAGLSMTEVAAVLGCPEGTAKSHVSRGLRRLRLLCTDGPPPTALPEPTGRRDRR